MKNLHIMNSYKIWAYRDIRLDIIVASRHVYGSDDPCTLLNRTFLDMYIEWILHNLGYYVTKPLTSIDCFKSINLRCKDVDLEERKKP